MIRILIANETNFLCNVISNILGDEPDMEVIGSAKTADDVINLAQTADVILVNSEPADGSALSLIRAVRYAGVRAKIIVFGLKDTPRQLVRFIQEGAAGYVLQDNTVNDFIERIREVYNGRLKVSPRVAAMVMVRITEYSQILSNVKVGDGDPAGLTLREQEILELIGQNLTNQQIAERLIIELGTVKNHVHNILQKLSTTSRREAAVMWVIEKNKANETNLFERTKLLPDRQTENWISE